MSDHPTQSSEQAEPAVRNASAEAQAIVGDEIAARVLEPSPPSNNDENFFADDPVAVDDVASGQRVVVPAGMATAASGDGASGTVSDWNEWLADNPEHGNWVARHWLGGQRRLPPVPANLEASRLALHRLAAYVIAPARHAVNGKFGLRWTAGGYGTPFFGQDRQVRVEGMQLVDQRGDSVRSAPISTLQAAAEFLAVEIDPSTAAEHDSPEVGDPNEPLAVEQAGADFLAGWYGMAFAALERVRAETASIEASRPQLWPGHFDPAIEVGSESTRGSYGASPGDQSIAEPYLYVSLWWPDRLTINGDDPVWNAPSFLGRVLKLSDFPADTDPVEVAVRFWTETRDMVG